MNTCGVNRYLVTMGFRLTRNDERLNKILPDMCKRGVNLPRSLSDFCYTLVTRFNNLCVYSLLCSIQKCAMVACVTYMSQ